MGWNLEIQGDGVEFYLHAPGKHTILSNLLCSRKPGLGAQCSQTQGEGLGKAALSTGRSIFQASSRDISVPRDLDSPKSSLNSAHRQANRKLQRDRFDRRQL